MYENLIAKVKVVCTGCQKEIEVGLGEWFCKNCGASLSQQKEASRSVVCPHCEESHEYNEHCPRTGQKMPSREEIAKIIEKGQARWQLIRPVLQRNSRLFNMICLPLLFIGVVAVIALGVFAMNNFSSFPEKEKGVLSVVTGIISFFVALFSGVLWYETREEECFLKLGFKPYIVPSDTYHITLEAEQAIKLAKAEFDPREYRQLLRAVKAPENDDFRTLLRTAGMDEENPKELLTAVKVQGN